MWKLLKIFLVFQTGFSHGKLIGDHVCLTEESYLVNVTEYRITNATVRYYEWCVNIPPRCSYYNTRKINESIVVEKNSTRTIERCCDGFVEENGACYTDCTNIVCKNGTCLRGKCNCSAGFHGATCDLECPEGFWGENCLRNCLCESSKCNPINGACIVDATTLQPPTPLVHRELHKEILIPVEIKYEEIKRPSSKRDGFPRSLQEKNYLSVGEEDYINKHLASEKRIFFNNLGIMGGIVLIIVIVIVALIITSAFRRSKTKGKNAREQPAVSVYATSIFHTPLPDPPTFENPTYIAPTEYQNYLNEPTTFKTHIISATDATKECKDYVYDHPPSTGSYRATSALEPSDLSVNQRLTEPEPVYDEIPQRDANDNKMGDSQQLSIYINTCGRTKL